MKIEGKERQLILSYIYERKVNSKLGIFVIRNKMEAEYESKIEYENMPTKEKIKTYRAIIDLKIKQYLFDTLESRSLFMEYVNGNPRKRAMRIMEFACNKVRVMSEAEKKKYYKEIGYRYLDE